MEQHIILSKDEVENLLKGDRVSMRINGQVFRMFMEKEPEEEMSESRSCETCGSGIGDIPCQRCLGIEHSAWWPKKVNE